MRQYLILLTLVFTGCASLPCRGVIGAAFDDKTYVVQYTYPGSPAEDAGVETGDTLVNLDLWSGAPGDVVEVEWLRRYDWMVVHMSHTTTLVCVDKLREWK